MPDKWEYLVLTQEDMDHAAGLHEGGRLQTRLGVLGSDGWELALVRQDGARAAALWVFKRPA